MVQLTKRAMAVCMRLGKRVDASSGSVSGKLCSWVPTLGAQAECCEWGMSESRQSRDFDGCTSIVNDVRVRSGWLLTGSTYCGCVEGCDKVQGSAAGVVVVSSLVVTKLATNCRLKEVLGT